MDLLNRKYSLSQGLIEVLEEMFPNRLPEAHVSIDELRYLQGQQSVIRKLIQMHEDNQEN
jgi:hypothetical protein